jgi:hypothetical protein
VLHLPADDQPGPLPGAECVDGCLGQGKALPSQRRVPHEKHQALVERESLTGEEALAIVEAFLATPYSGAERHTRRIDMITAYEKSGELPSV